MKKNDIVRLTICAITNEGNGVGRYEGMTVFIPFTVVGDVIDCRIVKVQKSFCYGKVESLVAPGGSRIKPDCPNYYKCGGCNMRHMTYSAELEAKQGFVRDAFTRIGGFEMLPEEIAPAPERTRYRNKAQLPICKQDDTTRFGFFSPRSHRVVPLDDCLIQPKNFSDIARAVCEYTDNNNLSTYDELTGRGLLRHIYIRQGYYSHQLMLCLVVAYKTDAYNALVPELVKNFPEIKTIVLNINPKQTNVILGAENQVLFGDGNIDDVMCDKSVSISPHSFYQINTPAAENVYKIAAEYANLKGDELLVDLYCGAGTVGLSMADKISKLIGVEIIPQAVENAKQNAKVNGVSNAEFICGDAGTVADELAKRNIAPDVIVVDPPRKGCDQKTLDAVLAMNPDRFVMISCNPATAARDCKYMCEHGYTLIKYRPADLFPGTSHVECVVLLTKVQK